MKLLMGTKTQFKMYLDDDLVARLRQAADRIGKASGQEVAEEIIKLYLPVWTVVNEYTQRAIGFQTNIVTEELRKLADKRSSTGQDAQDIGGGLMFSRSEAVFDNPLLGRDAGDLFKPVIPSDQGEFDDERKKAEPRKKRKEG